MANVQDVDKLTQAVESATAFPVLTEDIGSVGSPGTATPAAKPGSYDTIVQGTLRDLLNWRPSATRDARGFVDALTQSFTCTEVGGRTVCTHVARSYVMQVQSDGGAVTGAQASIHSRAKAAIDQSLPLLAGLYPLSPDSDQEDLVAVTATVRLGLNELVEELGRSGGPRPQRVDSLFDLLLGIEITGRRGARFSAEEVGGQLGLLRDRLGFEPQRVNTAEEEKNLTNFLILADYVFTLWLSWRSLRTYFDRTGGQVFLGPQLVLLSRALAVVAESVQETYLILDSVFVGPAERETTLLHFKDRRQAPLTLAELLGWAERFAAEEAPELITQAGKDGVIAFRPTLERLVVLFAEAVAISRNPSANPTAGVHTQRVANFLDAIRIQLKSAEQLARPLSREPQPKVDAVDPSSVPAGSGRGVLNIEGENFLPKSLVWLDLSGEKEQRVEPWRIAFVSPYLLRATFDLSALEADSEWTVVVTNPDGARSFHERALKVESAVPPTGPSSSGAAPSGPGPKGRRKPAGP